MFKELLNISGYPYLLQGEKRSFADNAKTLFTTYGIIFLFLIAITPVLLITEYCVTHLLHFPSIQKENSDSFQHMVQKAGYVKSMIYICFLGPILEESVFRLPLSFRKFHIALSIALAILFFGGALPFVKLLPKSVGMGYALLVRVAFSAIIYFISLKLIPANLSLSPAIKKAIIIISICLFGLMHISNYIPLQWPLIWIYPIYVLPQLGMGWALSYIRFKNGFIWGVALHCLINSVSMLISTSHKAPVKIKQIHQIVKPALLGPCIKFI